MDLSSHHPHAKKRKGPTTIPTQLNHTQSHTSGKALSCTAPPLPPCIADAPVSTVCGLYDGHCAAGGMAGGIARADEWALPIKAMRGSRVGRPACGLRGGTPWEAHQMCGRGTRDAHQPHGRSCTRRRYMEESWETRALRRSDARARLAACSATRLRTLDDGTFAVELYAHPESSSERACSRSRPRDCK